MSADSAIPAVRPRRPVTVTIAVVLLYLVGAFGLIVGLVVLFARYLPEVEADGEVRLVSFVGIAGILFGLLVIGLASSVARGSRLGRWSVTALMLLVLGLDVASLIEGADDLWWTTVDIVAVLYVLGALWLGPARRFFIAR